MKLYTFLNTFSQYNTILTLVAVLEDYFIEGKDYELMYETPSSEVPWGVKLTEETLFHPEVYWIFNLLFQKGEK